MVNYQASPIVDPEGLSFFMRSNFTRLSPKYNQTTDVSAQPDQVRVLQTRDTDWPTDRPSVRPRLGVSLQQQQIVVQLSLVA